MANPATLLLVQLSEWRTTHEQSNDQLRNFDNEDGHLKMRIAVRHLDAIEGLVSELSEAGRRVGVYQRAFPEWTRAVFVYPRGWNSGGQPEITQTLLDTLELLADTLDSYIPRAQPGASVTLRTSLDELRDLLIDDESIPADFRLHLRNVMGHVGWCLDQYDLLGDFELKKAVDQLLSTVAWTGTQSANKEKWRSFLNGFVTPFVVNSVSAIPSAALVQLALPGGS